MSGLDNLRNRLEYRGGTRQIDRMHDGKLKALKKALLYSYQSATAILADGREFRCLINKDKTKINAEDKIISIPFEDICLNKKKVGLTSQGIEEIGMKPGDVFTWKETNTSWLVYMQRLEETAYFRAEIRNCDYTIDVNGKEYKIFARKRSLTEIPWNTKQEISWNDLDYTLEMYITKNEETLDYFKRFSIVKINNNPWEVQAIDDINTKGIIVIALKEYYKNSLEEAVEQEKQEEKIEIDATIPHIEGDLVVYPYDTKTYSIQGVSGGVWDINSSKAIIKEQSETEVTIEIISGRSGEFELRYKRENEEDIVLNITIESL